jgi:hypothetical protein
MLVMAALFIVALRDRIPGFTSRLECGTDPQDFLRAGEMLDGISLRISPMLFVRMPAICPDGRMRSAMSEKQSRWR